MNREPSAISFQQSASRKAGYQPAVSEPRALARAVVRIRRALRPRFWFDALEPIPMTGIRGTAQAKACGSELLSGQALTVLARTREKRC